MTHADTRIDLGRTLRKTPALRVSQPHATAAGIQGATRAEFIDAAAVSALLPHWQALQARALEANAFHAPEFLSAALCHFPRAAAPRLLAIWQQTGPARRLIGLFPLAPAAWGAPSALRLWTHPLSANSVPLVDRDAAVDAIRTALLSVRGASGAHVALIFNDINWEGVFAEALRMAVADLDLPLAPLSVSARAALSAGSTPPPDSGRRMKERRRQYRRLAERGHLTFEVVSDYAAVRLALEDFLSLEASGWKGRQGTALIQTPVHANFTRAMLWAGARQDTVRIAVLALDGAPVASGILISDGRRCFFWKIAYSEAHAIYSPGALLALRIADWVRAEGMFDLVDSCAVQGHGMIESVWPDRIAMADVMVGLRADRTSGYRVALTGERLRRRLRHHVKTIYNRLRTAA